MFSTQDVKSVCFPWSALHHGCSCSQKRVIVIVIVIEEAAWPIAWGAGLETRKYAHFHKKKQTNKQRTKQNKQSLDEYHSYLILTGMFQKVLEGLSIMFLRKQRR